MIKGDGYYSDMGNRKLPSEGGILSDVEENKKQKGDKGNKIMPI